MSGLQPETRRALGIMLREMEQTVMPELNSAHAKTVAHLIGRGLRNLLTREEGLPELLEKWSSLEAELIISTGQALPRQAAGDMVTRNQALGEAVEAIIIERMKAKATLDDFCKSAIEAEGNFYQAHEQSLNSVSLPQRTPERRDLLAMTPERLTAYFARKLPQYKALCVTGVTPILSGFSKQTMLVDMEADNVAMPVVIRRDIPYGAVSTSVVDEYPLVAALHRQGLPVPEPVLLETDVSEFGEAFSVTRRAPGVAATNAMAGLVAGPEMTTAAYALAAFLARQHRINLDALALPKKLYDPAMATHDYLIREIDICERYYRNHRLQPSPTITAALAWLRNNVPQVEGPPRLVHGDASLNNVMMDGDKLSVMLDWELWHPGDPVEDVTYTRKWIDQFMSWDDFLARYYQHGGPQYLPEREKFYAMLSDLRVALFATRTQDMLNKGDHPEITHMYAAQHYYGYFIGNVAKSLINS